MVHRGQLARRSVISRPHLHPHKLLQEAHAKAEKAGKGTFPYYLFLPFIDKLFKISAHNMHIRLKKKKASPTLNR